ncbi:hypothetical protein NQZ68_004478 [Dissostichus eleginoides]|nr:hypothetical protein NQZ68_004478 [Dissostichus eleginoides]
MYDKDAASADYSQQAAQIHGPLKALRQGWEHLRCEWVGGSVTGSLKTCSRHTFHEWSCLTQRGRGSKSRGEGEQEGVELSVQTPRGGVKRDEEEKRRRGGCISKQHQLATAGHTPAGDTARGGGPVSRGEAEGETSKHGC